jgi:hypothetical protein
MNAEQLVIQTDALNLIDYTLAAELSYIYDSLEFYHKQRNHSGRTAN